MRIISFKAQSSVRHYLGTTWKGSRYQKKKKKKYSDGNQVINFEALGIIAMFLHLALDLMVSA